MPSIVAMQLSIAVASRSLIIIAWIGFHFFRTATEFVAVDEQSKARPNTFEVRVDLPTRHFPDGELVFLRQVRLEGGVGPEYAFNIVGFWLSSSILSIFGCRA